MICRNQSQENQHCKLSLTCFKRVTDPKMIINLFHIFFSQFLGFILAHSITNRSYASLHISNSGQRRTSKPPFVLSLRLLHQHAERMACSFMAHRLIQEEAFRHVFGRTRCASTESSLTQSYVLQQQGVYNFGYILYHFGLQRRFS